MSVLYLYLVFLVLDVTMKKFSTSQCHKSGIRYRQTSDQVDQEEKAKVFVSFKDTDSTAMNYMKQHHVGF